MLADVPLGANAVASVGCYVLSFACSDVGSIAIHVGR